MQKGKSTGIGIYAFILIMLPLLAINNAVANTSSMPKKTLLQNTLSFAKTPQQRLEALTNLMDFSHQQEQITYAKQLYQEALKNDNDYYKEAALTELLRYYVNNDIKDTANFYLKEAKKVLPKKASDFLCTYMKTILDVRVVFYTQGKAREKLIKDYKIKEETDPNLTALDKMSINYLLAINFTQRIDPGNESALNSQICYYFKKVIKLSDNIPLRYSYLFRLNPFNMLALYSLTKKEQVNYAFRYLNMQKEYLSTDEMKKRPYVTKRHLLNAYSLLAMAVEELGKDMASQYFKEFKWLMKEYPQDDPMGEYNLFFTSCNYYMKTKDFRKAANYCDSIIHYLKNGPLSATLSDNVIQILSDKTNCLDSLHDYKGAYETYKQYVFMLDSARVKNMQSKVNDLEITKQVDQIAVEKKTLELDLQKSHTFLYLVLSLLILSVAIAVFVFFRLGKIQSLYKHLQETNNLLDLARKKAEESEQMKNSFIKNMCHEVRTPLNAINGFAELISDEGASTEEKKEFSRIIFANCNDITSMMNNVLVISEMDNSHSMFNLTPTHLDIICQYEMEKLKKLKAKAGILYSIEGDRNNDLVLSAQNQLSVIISHLLDNANKFTETGEIILAYKHNETENKMYVSISDTGCGIPIDKKEWIFERFTKNNDFIPGSGLGLYMCKLIAQHLDGSLTLDTTYVGGARFILSLPLPKDNH